ncbi:purine/pyrimidine permease [Pseudonocardia kujensis]|uniref:uracil-xanthine permease family protein n=1 Tax=Pseudonocardia kujensis TaxID=1128675 RepID=UPI001E2A1851|nr:solute carrier family 23 protein [Pseudonocardia kujensis]MCE0768601.1 purine/pyrimidine permease [Pseudonocardia kujensis]
MKPEQPTTSFLSVGFDTKLPLARTSLFGMQHLLALSGIWLIPGMIGAALDLETRAIAWLVQGSLLLSGLVTILQSSRVLRLPIVQGPSVAFMVAIIAIGSIHGLGTAFGSMAVAGAIFALLCLPLRRIGLFGYFVPLISKPIVFGSFFLIIGAQLASYGISGWFGNQGQKGYGSETFVISLLTFLAVVALYILGGTGTVSRCAVLWGSIIGVVLAGSVGLWNVADTASASIVRPPEWLPFGFDVRFDAVLLMLGAFLGSASEAVGMYEMVGRWGGQKVGVVRTNRGLFAEMMGTAVGALFAGVGSTSYPENAGLVRISRVGSRYVTMAAGVAAVVLAFIPKVSLLIASVPTFVIGAAATVLYGSIMISGVQILREVDWEDQLNVVVAGPAVILALGAHLIPADIVNQMPEVVANLVTSPMMVGLILLIVLNVVVNHGIRPLLQRNRRTVGVTNLASAEDDV